MLRYEMLAVDVDGTLLDSGNEVPRAHAEALMEAERAGVRIVLASGRMIPSTVRVGDELGLQRGPVVGYNGARVANSATGEVLLDMPVRPDLAAELVRRFRALSMHINYYLGDVLYVERWTEWGDLYTTRTGSEQHVVGDLRQFEGQAPTKLLIIGDIPVIERLCPQYQAEYGDRLYVTITNAEYLEFMNLGASKAAGVERAAQALGVPRERVAAIGDARNDRSMVEWAGLGCAMGNAHEGTKAVADVIAPSCDDNGLAWFVREYILP